MEDFYSKYNFNTESSRTNKHFHIVRYYPRIQTYEFLNVGILLYSGNSVLYRLLKREEIAQMHCPILMQSDILNNSLESLDAYLQQTVNENKAMESISKRYTNILDTSFRLVYSGLIDGEDLINKLFYDYIGYKLDKDDSETTTQKLVKKTTEIVEQDFKKYISVKKSKVKGYTLDFFHLHTSLVHHSLLGSLENSLDVGRALSHAPANASENEKYDFLSIKSSIGSQYGSDNKIKLGKLSINVHDYNTDSKIQSYIDNILVLS